MGGCGIMRLVPFADNALRIHQASWVVSRLLIMPVRIMSTTATPLPPAGVFEAGDGEDLALH